MSYFESFIPKDIEPIVVAELKRLETLMEELLVFENNNPENQKVTQALHIIDRVVKRYKGMLRRSGTLVAYHGSLQYKDPENLDADLSVATRAKAKLVLMRPIIQLIQNELADVDDWPKMGENRKCDTDISTFSIDELEIQLNELGDNEISDEDGTLDLFVGFLLNSRPLFDEQRELFEEYKSIAISMVLSSKPLRLSIIKLFEKIVSTRQQRKLRSRDLNQ